MPHRGFTLIEVIITLALLSALAGLGLFANTNLYRGEALSGERDAIVSLLDRARSRSMENTGGTAHGLCVRDDAYEVFAAGEIEERGARAKGISVRGIPDCEDGGIVFSQLSGTTTGAEIVVSKGAQKYEIQVNEAGAILW